MQLFKNRVAKNAYWIIGSKIVQSVLGLFISMLTARYLGPSNYGLLSYASSLVAFVVPIMNLGLNNILVNEIINTPEKEGKILGTALVMNVVSAVACMIGVTTFAMIANAGERDTIIVCFLYSFVLLVQAIETIQYWCQAKLMSKYVSVAALFAYVVISVYKIYLLVTQKSIYWFTVSNALDGLIIAISLLAIYNKKKSQKLQFSFSLAKQLFSRSRYYIVSNMMITIFAQTDRIMIKLMIDDAQTGIYSAAFNCASITAFVFSAIIDSMRPVIFESKKTDNERYEKNLKRLYCVVIYLAIAQSAVFTIGAPLIIGILYGEAYSGAISVLSILVWYSAFSYIGGIRSIWILAEQKQKYLWIINLSGAILNVVLNFVLIKAIGVCGAALASVITQIFTNVIISFIIKPIRYSNKLLFESLNPKLLIEFFKSKKAK